MTTSTASRSLPAERLLLIAILMVAIVARFRNLPQIEHNIDHAYPVWQAMTTLDRGEFPIAGQMTSVLFANPALTGYLFIPVVALTRSPLAVYVFVVTLNTLAVWMAFRAVRSLLGTHSGLIAAGLMALNPWVIEYSRTSWVQSLLPFFVCGVAWLLWPVLMGRSRRPGLRLLLALVMTTALTQTYLLGYFILAPLTVLLLIFRRRIPLGGLLAGMVIFAAATLVFIASAFQDPDAVQQRLDQFAGSEARFTLESWEHAARLVSGAQYEVARGVDAPANDAAWRHEGSQVAHVVIISALVLGSLLALVAVEREPGARRDAGMIALVWFWLPVLAMSYTSNMIHPTYQLLGLPAGYVLAAWGFSTVFSLQNSRFGAALLLIAAVPYGALMLTNSARYYEETAALPGAHDLGALPVEIGLILGERINAYLPLGGVVYADMPEWIANSFAGRLFPVVRDLRAPSFSIIPAAGGLIISMQPDNYWLPFAARIVDTINLVDGSRITLAALPPADRVQLPGNMINVSTEQGIRLLSYHVDASSKPWTLTTVWRVDFIGAEVPARIFAPFVHVHDRSGERVLIVDGEGLAGAAWSRGDLHVHTMRFTPPADAQGPFTLLLGQYDGIHGVNMIFTPASAAPTAVINLPIADAVRSAE